MSVVGDSNEADGPLKLAGAAPPEKVLRNTVVEASACEQLRIRHVVCCTFPEITDLRDALSIPRRCFALTSLIVVALINHVSETWILYPGRKRLVGIVGKWRINERTEWLDQVVHVVQITTV
jgi:hypothetical protein